MSKLNYFGWFLLCAVLLVDNKLGMRNGKFSTEGTMIYWDTEIVVMKGSIQGIGSLDGGILIGNTPGGSCRGGWDGNWCRIKSGSDWLTSRVRNKVMKVKNGNRGHLKQNIRLYHWNMGHSWWEAKILEIQAVVNEVDPDLMFISEANLREGVDEVASHVEGYELVYPCTMTTQGYARIMLLVKEGVRFKKMENFMDENAASIWVKIEKMGGGNPCTLGEFIGTIGYSCKSNLI